MSAPVSDPSRTAGAVDMFLSIDGARSGAIRGEAHDETHQDDVEVLGWSWGMQGRTSLGGGTASGKVTVRELRIVKRIDKASTALMSAVRSNEVIAKAVLTLRKAGRRPLEYLKITIEDGRVVSLDIDTGEGFSAATAVERVTFSFNKIRIEYTPQGPDGQPRGSTSFEDQWAAG